MSLKNLRAGSIIAMQTLARSAPDGSVLAFQTNNMVTAPLLMRSPPYNAVEDFTPIAMVGSIPLVLVVNSKRIDATNAEEFIELLKQKGGQLNFGSSGPGTTLHLAVEMIAQEIGVKLNHIPYKGVGPMVTDLVAGQIDFAVSALPPVHGHLKSNALRSIGLLTEQHIVAAPEIPTFAEQGFPNFIMDVWMAVLGPSKMPAETVKKVHDAILASFNNPTIKNTIEKQGNIVKVSTPEEALGKIRSDVQRYTDMAKKINLVAH
ncbi:MAG: tripartite tricarboxylate transporter substrate binding protein [Advenella sp.]|nr:tripartite tricarboxylate transporter substrate binding protein [Advenella sp.]